MILAIVGDVTSDEAFAAAQRVFGGWPRAALPAASPVEPPPSARRIVIIDKPDAVQTSIRVGQLAIPRKHPDYMAWDLAVKILGGEGANRLHQVLRSQYGLTYGAEADTEGAQGRRRFRRADRYAHRHHRAGAAADDRRVRAPAARARGRARAVGRAGVPVGQLPADDRNAGSDRHAGAERAVLRPADLRDRLVPRARAGRHAGRHPARGAAVREAGSPVDRAGRQRARVRVAADRARAWAATRSFRSISSISCLRR